MSRKMEGALEFTCLLCGDYFNIALTDDDLKEILDIVRDDILENKRLYVPHECVTKSIDDILIKAIGVGRFRGVTWMEEGHNNDNS